MTKTTLVPLVAGLSAISLMGFGCNPVASLQQKVEQKVGNAVANGAVGAITGGKVSMDGDNKNFVFKDNKTGSSIAVGEDVTIPADFPKDAPRYPGAKAISVSVRNAKPGENEGGVSAVVLKSTDDVAKVTTWYEAQAKSAGWTEDSNTTLGKAEMRQYSKANLKLTVLISPSDDQGVGSIATVTFETRNGKE